MTDPSIDPTARKACSKCKEVKLLTEYYASKKAKDTKMGMCIPCVKDKVSKWAIDNKDRHRQQGSDWIKRNPERRRAITKRYYETHKIEYLKKQKAAIAANPEYVREVKRKSAEKHRDKRIAYYWTNREAMIKKGLQYQRDNPDVVKASKGRYRASKYAAEVRDFTRQQWIELQDRYDHRCAYCEKRFKGKLTQDHVIPLSKGGNHTISNIVPACRSCNSIKGPRSVLRPVQTLLLSMITPLKGITNVSCPESPPHLAR